MGDVYKLPESVRQKARQDHKAGKAFTIRPNELIAQIDAADKALNGTSNDAEHEALFFLREFLSDVLEQGAH